MTTTNLLNQFKNNSNENNQKTFIALLIRDDEYGHLCNRMADMDKQVVYFLILAKKMSIESIIGIVAGIFGILTGVAWLNGVVKSRVKPNCSNDLFKELTNKQLTDAKKKEILVKLNRECRFIQRN